MSDKRKSLAVALLVASLLLLAVIPVFVTSTYIRHLFILCMVYAVVAANWDLSLGSGGVFNFAHISFFGIGMYACAILGKTLGINPWLAIVAAGLAATIAAAVVSLPIVRLRGIYVVLVTFAFAQLLQMIILSQSWLTGGSDGMVLLPPLRIGDYNLGRDGKFAYYYLALALLAVTMAFLFRLHRSSLGYAIRAVRDDENYAAARSISIARTQFMMILLSAPLTGLAGGFYATYARVASIDVFGFGLLSLILSMVLLGGLGSIVGPVLASFLLTFSSEALVDLGLWRFLIVPVVMVTVLIAFPDGLASIGKAVTRLANQSKLPVKGESAAGSQPTSTERGGI